jgi:hypothetical protein
MNPYRLCLLLAFLSPPIGLLLTSPLGIDALHNFGTVGFKDSRAAIESTSAFMFLAIFTSLGLGLGTAGLSYRYLARRKVRFPNVEDNK